MLGDICISGNISSDSLSYEPGPEDVVSYVVDSPSLNVSFKEVLEKTFAGGDI